MGWKTVVGTGSIIVAVAGGCWWAVAASAVPPTPVIGPALVVTPATGIPSSPSAVATRSPDPATPAVPEPPAPSPSPSPSATSARDIESPEAVDRRWVRPVDGDDEDDDEDEDEDDEGEAD